MIKKIIKETEKIEKELFAEEKDSALLILEMEKQIDSLSDLKQKLSETEEQRLERIKNILKGK